MKKTQSLPSLSNPLRFLLTLLLTLVLFANYRSCTKIHPVNGTLGEPSYVRPTEPSGSQGSGSGITTLLLSQAPRQVRKLIKYLKRVRHFNPPSGYRGGRVFRNREGALPRGKTYYEYDVHPNLPNIPRGAERLVVDQQKQNFYYTTNHYRTFIKIE